MPPELTHQPKVHDVMSDPYRFLLYGDFGRRKTTLATTFPKSLVIDTNGGLVSAALQGVEVVSWTPDGYEDLEALYFHVKKVLDEAPDQYETIVVDTIDNLALQLMSEITEDDFHEKQSKGKSISMRMRFVPEQGDYFASQGQMFRFLTALRRLNKHIVLVSSSRIKQGRTAPNVSDGMERVICDFVSVVGELVLLDEEDCEGETDPEIVPGAGVMFTQEANSRATKSRFRSIKPFVVNPTFEKLDAAIKAEIEEATKRNSAGRK